MSERYTDAATAALQGAQQLAHQAGHPELTPLHLSSALLAEDQLELVSAAVVIEEKESGRALFRAGDDDKTEFFLLSGSLNLTAKDGAMRKVVAGEELARHPVARLRY